MVVTLVTFFNSLCLLMILFVYGFVKYKINRLMIQVRFLEQQAQILSVLWKPRMHHSLLSDDERKALAFLAHELRFNPQYIFIANPKTFKNWYWRFFGSDSPTGKKGGRPRIALEVKELVWKFRKLYHWGYDKIVGDLASAIMARSELGLPWPARLLSLAMGSLLRVFPIS